eukprot:gnl/Dysnectes_brevis/3337_a4192_723.p1 GENE.gnl/Dysnectes_brevis/3337_a4192_723~~gnl/Dysnectes_brevis/3337_a4192_723.p1  ORF type:complete len:473 (-),score=112.46 gnl/Dysnectes_brevis/3337_a4192_723:56-1474(-)
MSALIQTSMMWAWNSDLGVNRSFIIIIIIMNKQETHLIETAKRLALDRGLCLQDIETDTPQFCPFSLSAAPISSTLFQRAKDTANAWSRLSFSFLSNSELLLEATSNAIDDPFIQRLRSEYQNQLETQEIDKVNPLLSLRTDFFLDSTRGISLIEANPIAAGMGPLCRLAGEVVQEAHREDGLPVPELITNPAHRLGEQFLQAVRDVHSDTPLQDMVALFLVQKPESNRYDIGLHAEVLERAGLTVVQLTMTEAAAQLTYVDGKGLLGDKPVAMVYYRCGYCAEDYTGDAEWEVRRRLDASGVPVSPSIGLHLTGLKAVQLWLGTNLDRLPLSPADRSLVRSSFTGMYPVAGAHRARALEDPGRYVLKNQGEGGGYCVFGEDIPAALERLGGTVGDWLLMDRLSPPVHRALMVPAGGEAGWKDATSEYGMFSVEWAKSPAQHSGYLVRTKLAEVNEGGVHAGFAVISPASFE